MKLGILKTDAVRPEWVPDFGEYPDMFIALLGRIDPDIEFAVYDVEEGEYPTDIDEVDAYLRLFRASSPCGSDYARLCANLAKRRDRKD